MARAAISGLKQSQGTFSTEQYMICFSIEVLQEKRTK